MIYKSGCSDGILGILPSWTPRRCGVLLLNLALIISLYINSDNIRNSLLANIKTLQESGKDSFPFQHHGVQKKRLPQAIIFGAKKCGTKALLRMINLHPHVVACKNEGHFFENDRKTGMNLNYVHGLEWYQEKMPLTYEDQITIDKTPSYFVSADSPKRIHDMNSSIKLILIVRDPTTRVIGDYAHVVSRNEVQLPEFEQEVIKPNGEVNKGSFIVIPSLYAEHMSRWLPWFKRDQILVVDGEKLISDPLTQITKVEKFLNIKPYIKEDNFYWNSTKGFYCMRSEVTEFCLVPTKGRPHPEVKPEIIYKLRKFFAPLNDQFYEMVGHNFSWPSS
ncbi:unnamed protein product [Meganyctiphanes norvegica]|uniref:Sulfotransferase domain-containing protein n=1 Tax=Meganyctiphanes norvegica TaxID=48144 RepID=A0AAV2QE06_MEGNR